MKVVGNNLQHLEVGEEKSRSREEGRQVQIVELQVIYKSGVLYLYLSQLFCRESRDQALISIILVMQTFGLI